MHMPHIDAWASAEHCVCVLAHNSDMHMSPHRGQVRMWGQRLAQAQALGRLAEWCANVTAHWV